MERSYDNISFKEIIHTLGACLKGFRLASVLTPLFMILEVVMEMVIPMLMASIIDEGVSVGDMNHIYATGLWMIIAAVVALFAGVMGGRFGALASTGLARNLRRQMYANIQTFSFSNIDRFSSSGLVTRLTTDVTNVQNAYQMILRMFMRSPTSLISAVFMSVMISPKLASIYLVAVVALGGFLCFVMSRVTTYFRQVFEKYDELNESVEENVSAIRVVKAFVREDYENEKFSGAAENIYRLFVRAEKMLISNMPVMQLTVYACILSISYFGAHLIVAGELSTGQLMSLLAYCLNILISLMLLSVIFVMVSMSSASARRITEVLNEKADISEPDEPVKEVPDGSIVFRGVSFRYNGHSEKAVLNHIDLSIAPGETIGIVGQTGSGKSTLVNLISRLYDVTEGELLIGGINVKEYSLEALRNSVAVVLQKNEIFSGTILENLRWGKADASEEEVRRAAEAACAHEFIERMSEGYETRIEQGGSNVSGGQKQRLCIARALLKSPKILILDDSTSAVDTATEAKIRRAFREYIPEVTKLIIAQRISSVADADRILVLDQGRVSAFAPHEELMQHNDIYRDIYESQNGNGDFDE